MKLAGIILAFGLVATASAAKCYNCGYIQGAPDCSACERGGGSDWFEGVSMPACKRCIAGCPAQVGGASKWREVPCVDEPVKTRLK